MALLKKSLNKKQTIKLKIPAEPEFISLVRLVLSAELRQNSVDEEEIEDLKMVLSEFLAKAMEARLVKDCFSIELSFNDGIMKVMVFNLEQFKPNELFNSPYLSFPVIKELVDHFDLLLGEKQRISLKITKSFNS